VILPSVFLRSAGVDVEVEQAIRHVEQAGCSGKFQSVTVYALVTYISSVDTVGFRDVAMSPSNHTYVPYESV
jgi:hypothetical protein